jgi:ParB/RepB/Spo0J family partition protein
MASKKQNKGSNMASKRNASNAAAADAMADMTKESGQLMVIRASRIDFESFQNVRSAGWQNETNTEAGDGSNFPALKASIATVGQKDPITVRPKPNRSGKGDFEFECIKGFQRGTAIKQIGAERKPEPDNDPLIKVIVKDLDDLQALEECTYENTARNNLNPADTAAAARRLLDAFKAKGINMSVNALADRMGKNQSWLNSLVVIARKGGKVFDLWQAERKVSVPALVMTKLLKECTTGEGDNQVVDLDKAEKLYSEVQKNKGKLPRSQNPDELKAATSAAKQAGNLLGTLLAAGHITLAPELQATTTQGLLVSCGISLKGLSAEQIRNVCNTLTAARIQAMAAATEAASKAGVTSTEPKRRGGKGASKGDATAN